MQVIEVDARGLLCPLPVLRLRRALMPLAEGAQVRLWCTDPASVIDVPHFCAGGGHRLLESAAGPEGHSFLVARGAAKPEVPSATLV